MRTAGTNREELEALPLAGLNKPHLMRRRRLPIGAEVLAEGGVHFRVWAPRAETLTVEISSEATFSPQTTELVGLEPEANGYFSVHAPAAGAGMFYRFRFGGGLYPDPASRFQPHGPHGPSQVVDPARFRWSDGSWPGLSRHGLVIYELHAGTFTAEGSWLAAMDQLAELARLGVTVLELMPVADFPGEFGWGYDGVNLFAPSRLYGTPEELRLFVDRAHNLGLGVILDVVYNHVGPDGNYLKAFSEDYFTDRHGNEWGQALNFDGEGSGPVREFFISNAAYWIEEFHLDGLRLDATQQIFDSSAEHILSAIGGRAREAAGRRSIWIVAENEKQEVRIALSGEERGYGLDGVWNDDFHHAARVALTGHNEAFYSGYRGTVQELISAVKWGYLYQGQWYSWQKMGRGDPAFGLAPEQFVNCLENHDQVSNSLFGKRLQQLSDPGRYRALTALLLLGPGTPMLFQGQEFWASSPFVFFADHNPELARLVRQGRGAFLKQFPSIASAECDAFMANPGDRESFLRCKLDLSEREKHAPIYTMHRDLLKLRRSDAVFSRPRKGGVEGAVLDTQAMVLRFFGQEQGERLLFVNLGNDLRLEGVAEPLLAPPKGSKWQLLWSSESPQYGGEGTASLHSEGLWRLPGRAAIVLDTAAADS